MGYPGSEVDCAADISCCAALWTSCYFGCGSARDNPHPAAPQFTVSVHLPLYYDRNRHHPSPSADRRDCGGIDLCGGVAGDGESSIRKDLNSLIPTMLLKHR